MLSIRPWEELVESSSFEQAAAYAAGFTPEQTQDLFYRTAHQQFELSHRLRFTYAVLALPHVNEELLFSAVRYLLTDRFYNDDYRLVFVAFLAHPGVTEEVVERLIEANSEGSWPTFEEVSTELKQLCIEAGRFSAHLSPRAPFAVAASNLVQPGSTVLPSVLREVNGAMNTPRSLDDQRRAALERKSSKTTESLKAARLFIRTLDDLLATDLVPVRRTAAMLLQTWQHSPAELATVARSLAV